MALILTRRLFIQRTCEAAGSVILAAALPLRGAAHPLWPAESDEEIFQEWMRMASEKGFRTRPIGEVVTAAGLQFLGSSYVAHTLEVPGEERLVVNLREFDCATLMENSFVLARCVKIGISSFAEYRQELQSVRYRGGTIDGYPSRLHYTTDWMRENEKAGRLRLLARGLGGRRNRKKIDFMTTHTDSYAQLSDSGYVGRIAGIEKVLTRNGFYFVPVTKLTRVASRLQSGDLIGTVATTRGLDISHTGIAVREGTTVKFLHASLSAGKVVLTDESLAEYVAAHKSMEGIVAARPLEPVTPASR